MLLERIREKERESAYKFFQNAQNSFFVFLFFVWFWGLGGIYSGFVIVQLSVAPKGLLASFDSLLGCARADVDISSLSFSLVQLQKHI